MRFFLNLISLGDWPIDGSCFGLLFLLDISQHFNDMLRHWRRSWKVLASGLEPVFIGHPVNSNRSAVGASVRVRAFRDGANVFWLGSDLLLPPTCLYFNAVSALKTVPI